MSKNYIKLAQLASISEMYYIKGYNQQKISEETGINRTAISRLLTEARERNIVNISVNYPLRLPQLEKDFLKEFPSLKAVHIAACTDDSYSTMLTTLGNYSAKFFMDNIKPGMIVGLGWGKQSTR